MSKPEFDQYAEQYDEILGAQYYIQMAK